MVGGISLFLLLMSFMAHDRFFNSDAPKEIVEWVPYVWLALAVSSIVAIGLAHLLEKK